MNDPLFFIRILVNAYDAPDRPKALQDAFETVQRLGLQPGYEQALAQCRAFLEEVVRQAPMRSQGEQSNNDSMIDLIIIGLATGTFDGTDAAKEALTTLVTSRPEWREKYECIRTDLQFAPDVPGVVEIILARDDVDLPMLSFARGGATHTIAHVLPGHYSMRLSTGRVLWAGELQREDVEWTAAFPGRALDLAAADARTLAGPPTREMRLLDGEVVMRIFPGLEAGAMVITVNG
jgi:hypothetical protein